MRRRSKIMIVWSVLALAPKLASQVGNSSAAQASPNVRDLVDQRRKLDNEVHDLQGQTDKLQRELDLINEATLAIQNEKNQLNDKPKDAYLIRDVEAWSNTLARYRPEETVKNELATTKNKLASTQIALEKMDSDLGDKVDSERRRLEFESKASNAFLILMGLIIGGFFWVAIADASVRATIFGGESGLQFITLFALVLAIIFFGLIEVLQGRELAALLGGISGYILGRSGRPKSSGDGGPPQPVIDKDKVEPKES